jgi:ribonuclease P protein component
LSTQSFSKKNRLLSSKEFSAVFERAQYRIGCSEFLILAIDNNLSTSRLGLVVGKKNTRLSVSRNSIKRVFRESFRKIALALYDNEGIDIVIITRPKVSKCSSEELSNQLTKIWPKLQVKVEKGKRND